MSGCRSALMDVLLCWMKGRGYVVVEGLFVVVVQFGFFKNDMRMKKRFKNEIIRLKM